MDIVAKIILLPYFAIVILLLFRAIVGRSLIMGRKDTVAYSSWVLGRILLVSIMGVVGGSFLIGASMSFGT